MTPRALCPAAADYPPRLRDLRDPPDPLYVLGDLPRGPAAAIVGGRKASPEGLEFARRLASELVREGIAVLSGGAEGIDTAAHVGALDAGGVTVVVAASGFEHPFPKENGELFRRIVRCGGAYAGAFSPDVEARRWQFLRRNHLLAALCSVLVVVEARVAGGAWHAAATARSLSRPVLVVPGTPWSRSGAGCAELLRRGARAMTSARDVLDVLGVPRKGEQLRLPAHGEPQRPPRRSDRSSTDPDEALVLEALRSGAFDPDSLCGVTGLPAGRIQALLLTLTLEGIVVSEPSGRLVIASA